MPEVAAWLHALGPDLDEIRTVTTADFSQILGLNEAEVQHTSPMAIGLLVSLVGMSAYCRVATLEGVFERFCSPFGMVRRTRTTTTVGVNPGFRELGRHWVANGAKQVSLQAADIRVSGLNH